MKGSSWTRDLLILTLLLGVLFGFDLGGRALWSPEEGRYSEIAREMVVSGDYVTLRLNGIRYLQKPPLFSWLQSATIKVFGLSEWSLRLWPAIFAIVGCLAVYVAGRKLFGRRTGLVSAAVLATSGLWYAMGHVINLDMAVSALLTCAMLAFLWGTKEPPGYKRRVAMWLFFAFAALATLTKGLIGIVIPALVIGIWILLLGEWGILKTMYLPSGLAVFLLIAAPWHVLVARANPEFLHHYFVQHHFERYFTRPKGPFQVWWAFIPVLLIGLFPWTVFLPQAMVYNLRFYWQQRRQHKEVIFLLLWAALVFLFFSASRFKVIPYILPMFPPLAMLIARYFGAIWDTNQRRDVQSGYWILAATVLLMMVTGFAAPQHYLERYSNWPNLDVPSNEATIVSTAVKQYKDLRRLTPYIYAQAGILFVGIMVALVLAQRRFGWGFLSLVVTWALFLVVLNSSLPLLDQRRSIKSLASVLRTQLHPADEVATYHAYYQDLPVYLQRYITVVGWKEEGELYAPVDNFSRWMIDDATFWKSWNGPTTIYALTDRPTYNKLRAEPDQKSYLVAQTDYDVVFSNKPRQHPEAG